MLLNAVLDLYHSGVTAIDPQNGRYISQASGDSNGYRVSGNAPDSGTPTVSTSYGAPDAYSNSAYRLIGEATRGLVGDSVLASASDTQLFFGTAFASAGLVLGGKAVGAAAAAGGVVGGIDGAIATYAADPNAGVGSYAVGIGLGALGGAVNPVGAVAGLAGGGVGAAISGGLDGDWKTGYLAGSTIAGVAAGSVAAYRGAAARGGTLLGSARRYRAAAASANVVGAGVGAGIEYYRSGGDLHRTLMGAAIGDGLGSIAGAKFIKCFVAGTPVATGSTSVDAAIEPSDGDHATYQGVWIASGLAAMAASRLLADERKATRALIPRGDSGVPIVPEIPDEPEAESGFSGLDFADICDELQFS